MNLIRSFRNLLPVIWASRSGCNSNDKFLAACFALFGRTGLQHGSRLDWLRRQIQNNAQDSQISFSIRRFHKRIRFSVREGNEADYRIAGELVMGEYDFDPLEKYDCIVDGGANIGMFTVQAASAHPNAEIVAYEPDPENLCQYRSNCATNSISSEVHEAAMWSEDTTVRFRKDTSMSGRVDEDGGERVVDARLPRIGENTWLKLDIEGAEYEVIPKLLEAPVLPRRITMELHFHDEKGHLIVDALREAGYELFGDIESAHSCIVLDANLKDLPK